jgi:hypothetical protein
VGHQRSKGSNQKIPGHSKVKAMRKVSSYESLCEKLKEISNKLSNDHLKLLKNQEQAKILKISK